MRFQNLPFKPSLSICDSTLAKLGVYKEVYGLLSHMRLGKFACLETKVHEDAAREFFSTVSLKYKDENRPFGDEGSLHFKIQGKRYEIEMERFCKIYGLPNGIQREYPRFNHASEFWDIIASGGSRTTLKISQIRHPAIRIVAKFLAHTLCYRNATGNMNLADLNLLYQGLYPNLKNKDGTPTFDEKPVTNVNLGVVFIESMIRIRNSTIKVGANRMGGLLWPLFKRMEIPLEFSSEDDKKELLNEDFLLRNNVLELKGGVKSYSYYLSNNNHKNVVLPWEEKMPLDKRENLCFDFANPPSHASTSNAQEEEIMVGPFQQSKPSQNPPMITQLP